MLEDDPEVLVGVWQDVEYERRAVLEVQPPVGALADHLVHHLPRLLYGLLVYGGLGLLLSVDAVRDGLEPVASRPPSHLDLAGQLVYTPANLRILPVNCGPSVSELFEGVWVYSTEPGAELVS